MCAAGPAEPVRHAGGGVVPAGFRLAWSRGGGHHEAHVIPLAASHRSLQLTHGKGAAEQDDIPRVHLSLQGRELTNMTASIQMRLEMVGKSW